jgi:hypothetical protein
MTDKLGSYVKHSKRRDVLWLVAGVLGIGMSYYAYIHGGNGGRYFTGGIIISICSSLMFYLARRERFEIVKILTESIAIKCSTVLTAFEPPKVPRFGITRFGFIYSYQILAFMKGMASIFYRAEVSGSETSFHDEIVIHLLAGSNTEDVAVGVPLKSKLYMNSHTGEPHVLEIENCLFRISKRGD